MKRRPTYEAILTKFVRARAADRGLSLTEVQGPRRHKQLVQFRREISRRAHGVGFRLSEIGRVLNRDHSTIRNLIMQQGHP